MGILSWSVLSLVATTGIITTAMNIGVGWFRDIMHDRKQNRIQAAYLAVRIAVILENFVNSCVYRSWHNDADLKEARELDYRLPKLGDFPSDSADWKSFYTRDPKLVGQILSFPNEILSAEMSCQFQGVHESNPFASADETVVAGITAWKLACAVRDRYRLAKVTIAHIESLERSYDDLKVRAEFSRAFAHYSQSETASS